MVKIFSHESLIITHNIKNLLELEGISCLIKNDMVNSSSGEVPPIEVWPEVWLKEDHDQARASAIVDEAMNGSPSKTSWLCQHCSESNGPAFEFCWQCGQERA